MRARCRNGTRSRSAVITCAKPARAPCKNWHLRWPTASNTSTLRCGWARHRCLRTAFGVLLRQPQQPAGRSGEVPRGAANVGKIMRERFRAQDPRSWMLRFHTQTAGVTLQAQQFDNNVVRVTVQALAAMLGGTQSLHTNAKDEALALPTEETAQLALRTQQVLAYESGVGDVVDPLAGSYFVESLTDEIERRAWENIERVDERGGALAAVEEGYRAIGNSRIGIRVSTPGRASGADHRRRQSVSNRAPGLRRQSWSSIRGTATTMRTITCAASTTGRNRCSALLEDLEQAARTRPRTCCH